MAVDPIESSAYEFTAQVERLYAGLMQAATLDSRLSIWRPGNPESLTEQEPSLGGKLLYAGELDAKARALLVAANIAGAASLAATADAAVAKQAVRDGVVDFLVTSLDEALRILKNEIRRRADVQFAQPSRLKRWKSRCKSVGVAPDIDAAFIFASLPRIAGRSIGCAARPVHRRLEHRRRSRSLAAQTRRHRSQLSSPENDSPDTDFETWDSTRRWLRQAPRYLGRMAQGLRLLRCTEQAAALLRDQIQQHVECAEIKVPVDFFINANGKCESFSFSQKTE